jgi:hypothetical protein
VGDKNQILRREIIDNKAQTMIVILAQGHICLIKYMSTKPITCGLENWENNHPPLTRIVIL